MRCADVLLASMCSRPWQNEKTLRARTRALFMATGRSWFYPYSPETKTTAIGCARCLSRRNHKDSPPPELLSWLEHNGNVADGMVRRGNRPWEPSLSWRSLLDLCVVGTE